MSEWFAWEVLPAPLFWPTRNLVDTGINPLEFIAQKS